MEDYSAGRKGPSGPSGLGGIGGGGGGGAGLFGRQQATQQTVSGGLFGAKPLGGGTTVTRRGSCCQEHACISVVVYMLYLMFSS